MVDRNDGGVLDMFEAVAHELDATKPASHADGTIADIMLLEHSEYDLACASLAIIALCFVNNAFVFNTGGKAVVISSHIRLIFFEGLEKGFDIIAAMYLPVAHTVATPTVFDDVGEEDKWSGWGDTVSEGKSRGGHRGIISDL